jgi:uncharacterized protein (TIGR03382 family)
MVSVKFLSVNLVAATAALGLGATASANVVTLSQTFFNSSSSTRTYTYYQYATVAGGSGASVMSGSVTATVSDLNGNGAVLSAVGSLPIYTATVNDVAMRTLWQPFSNFNVGQFLSQSTTPGAFANEVIPGGSTSSDALLGIMLKFTLSAGDTVSFASTFTVSNVPGPGAMALLAVSGAAGVGRRRKR